MLIVYVILLLSSSFAYSSKTQVTLEKPNEPHVTLEDLCQIRDAIQNSFQPQQNPHVLVANLQLDISEEIDRTKTFRTPDINIEFSRNGNPTALYTPVGAYYFGRVFSKGENTTPEQCHQTWLEALKTKMNLEPRINKHDTGIPQLYVIVAFGDKNLAKVQHHRHTDPCA